MNRYFTFALFAAALLLSMIGEWNAPVGCPFPRAERTVSLPARNVR
jgi:hypothetical protein